MAEHVRSQDSSHIENVDTAHDRQDVNVRAILMVGGALVVTAIVVHILIYVLYLFLEGRTAARMSSRAFPLAPIGTQMPRAPKIQPRPAEDLLDLRRTEDDVLGGYAWIDQKAGVARIPIEQAMKLVVQRGLPARDAAATPAGAGR